MISNTRQNWTVGHNVKVGFLTPFPRYHRGEIGIRTPIAKEQDRD